MRNIYNIHVFRKQSVEAGERRWEKQYVFPNPQFDLIYDVL